MNDAHPQGHDWQNRASIHQLRLRAQLIQAIRQFFSARQVLEVETPLLSQAAVSDPQIESIATHDESRSDQPNSDEHTNEAQRWLRTSPEYCHKRLLANGSGDIYELGKVFRKGEAGRWHNPEFTMLEWYRMGWHYHQLMDEVEALVRQLLALNHELNDNQQGKSSWPCRRFTYRELHQELLDFDPFTLNREGWISQATKHGLSAAHEENTAVLQDFVYGVAMRQQLSPGQLTFVYDFPLNQAALARIRHDTPPVAERFELFMGQIEVANGYQELTDAEEQAQRFENDQALRKQFQQNTAPIDQHLLAALQNGLPECSGVAMGIDRVIAQICGHDQLNAVLSFDWTQS